MAKRFSVIFKITLIVLGVVFFISPAMAAYDRYAPGTVRIGEFVYGDDYAPSGTDCWVYIYDPDGVLAVDPVPKMVADAATGWHYYDFTGASALGVWPTHIQCGTLEGGDLAKLDKTFIVGTVNVDTAAVTTAVWGNGTGVRTLTAATNLVSDIATGVWGATTSALTTPSSIGLLLTTNINAKIGDIAVAVWGVSGRSLTSRLIGTGEYIAGVQTSYLVDQLASQTDVTTILGDVSTIKGNVTSILADTGDIAGIKTATDSIDWSDVTGIVTDTGLIKAKTDTIDWANVTGIKTKTDTIAWADVTGIKTKTDTISWADVTAAKNDAASILVQTGDIAGIKTATDSIDWSDVTGIVTDTGLIKAKTDTIDWANVTGIKTKTDTIAWADVTGIKAKTDTISWADVTSRAALSSQQAGWTVSMSNVDRVLAGQTYRARIYVLNYESVPTDSEVAPQVTLYNTSRTEMGTTAATWKSAGVYEYTYPVATTGAEGLWETVVSTQVATGKTIQTNDYWTVEGSPAHVGVNEITDKIGPDISANVTITNEGLVGYEYHYTWCVVRSALDTCNGTSWLSRDTASSYIGMGKSLNTNLAGTVPSAGDYIFKLVVYYGAESSGGSKSFTATMAVTPTCGDHTCNGGESCSSCSADCGTCSSTGDTGGGGGGGGGSSTILPEPLPETRTGITTLGAGQAGTATATTNQGTILTVDIPADSITAPTTISATPVASGSSSVPSLPASSSGLSMLGNLVFNLQSSSGQRNFPQPLTLTFRYTDAEIINLVENTLKVYWYDEAGAKWQPLSTVVNAATNVLTVQVDHFTVFAIFGQAKVEPAKVCSGADFNHDGKVNSVDFSILLAFWKTAYPFKNSCVDINADKQVNSIDFSILMYNWGRK